MGSASLSRTAPLSGGATPSASTIGPWPCSGMRPWRAAFRADAAFAKPEIYEALEQRDVDYAIRMPANMSVELDIEALLFSASAASTMRAHASTSDPASW